MKHTEYMDLALAEAALALAEGEVPVGAVLVRQGRVLARGHNMKETRKDPTAHAELVVIRRAARAIGDWRLDGATLYVTLEPCGMCASAIVQARIATLVYGAPDTQRGEVESQAKLRDNLYDHDIEIFGGYREAACRELLERFFSRIREQGKEGT